MSGKVLMDNNSGAGIANVRRRYFIVAAGAAHGIDRYDLVVVGLTGIRCRGVVVVRLSASNSRERCLAVADRPAQNLIARYGGVAIIGFGPGKMDYGAEPALRDGRCPGG